MNRRLLATRDKDEETVIVLYELPDNTATPWVTWVAPKNARHNTVWGHYFNSVVDAVHDFDNR